RLELLVRATLELLHRRQLALLLDPDCALLLGHGVDSSSCTRRSGVPRLDHVDPLRAQALAGIGGARGRATVDVDMAAVDRAAGVLRDEPAAETVVAI